MKWLGDQMMITASDFRNPKIDVFVFSRAMCCPHCMTKHKPGEVTHVVRSDILGLSAVVCNQCHTVAFNWLVSVE